MSYLFRLAMYYFGCFLFGKDSIWDEKPLTEKEAAEKLEECSLTSNDLAGAKADTDVINKII